MPKQRQKVTLGKTGLQVTKTAFGALPVQRVAMPEAVKLLRAAYDGGINFFDTANAYTDSERKIGEALADVRGDIIIATKSAPVDTDGLKRNLEQSLRDLKTDYIDIYQLHNAQQFYGEESEQYRFLLDAKRQGLVRHIGITSHQINLAKELVASGLYETMQFPFSVLSSPAEIELVQQCAETNTGFIAMKAMSGGLIRSPKATFAFIARYPNVVPIYGIQRMAELEQWLALDDNPPADDAALQAVMEEERAALAGDFCRGCGYCMPCAVGLNISWDARMSLLLTRSPYQPLLADEWCAEMEKIEQCIDCGLCASRCPYGLDTPNLLRSQLSFYRDFYARHRAD